MSTAIILCYHKVGPVAEEGRRLNIEPARLRAHVAYFARRGFVFLRGCDLADTWPSRCVSFTFDDAYESTMANTPAVFEAFGKRASFYAVAGKVGASSDWDGELARPLAGWEMLLSAQSKGHEIGNHTLTHPHLAELSVEDQKAQIRDADRVFRDRGIMTDSFCYPYGSVGETSVLGYRVGLALGKRPATSQDDRLRLPRIVVAYSDGLPMLLYKIYLKPVIKRAR
jgi:peptidoglycan/xylan/chitin deacetylase (PgdA/CDA1 family)